MPFFVDAEQSYVPVAVGIVQSTILAASDIRGVDHYLIVITNTSATETLNAVTSCSPDGVNQWVAELNDEFESIGPGVTRRMLLPADRCFVRVLGAMSTTPDEVRLSTTNLKKAMRRG